MLVPSARVDSQEHKESTRALGTALEWVVCESKALPSGGKAGQSTDFFD
jgi:hypothetical protein